MHTLQTLGSLALAICSLAGFPLMLLGWLRRRFSRNPSLRLTALGFVLVGTGIFCFAVTDLAAIHGSITLTAEGSIASLREVHTRGDAYFFSVAANPPTPELAAYYTGLHLKNGDLVRASYVSNTGEITALTILTGTDALKKLHGGNGSGADLGFILLAGAFIAIGIILARQAPGI